MQATPRRWISQARQHGHEVLLRSADGALRLSRQRSRSAHAARRGAGRCQHRSAHLGAVTRSPAMRASPISRAAASWQTASAGTPVLTFAARRGLLFFEPAVRRQIRRARIRRASLNRPTPKASVRSTQRPLPPYRPAAFRSLKRRRRANGAAAASASAYPITLARINTWAPGLSGRGFVLVPASAIVAAVQITAFFMPRHSVISGTTICRIALASA